MRLRPNLVFAWVVLLGGGCRTPLPPSVRPSGQLQKADPVGVSAELLQDGMPIAFACTPTGLELCFDAIDNNCNGVIDEGCGVRTGPLQFTIGWDATSNVDLIVTDPSGNVARPDDRTPAGLTKDVECESTPSDCHGQNIENVYLEGERVTKGSYLVKIRLTQVRGASLPLAVQLGARLGARVAGTRVELASEGAEKSFVFHIR